MSRRSVFWHPRHTWHARARCCPPPCPLHFLWQFLLSTAPGWADRARAVCSQLDTMTEENGADFPRHCRQALTLCILCGCVMQSLTAFPPLPLQWRFSFLAACAKQPADRHRSVGEITSYPSLRQRQRERPDELYICIYMPGILCHSVGFLL